MRRIPTLISSLLLLAILGGCDFNPADGDPSDDCAPHHDETIPAPDGRHVAERWISICGAPGATVTDLVSVTDQPVARPAWNGVFAFEEEGENHQQVSASWVDAHELRITIDSIGEVRDSPRRMSGVAVTYVLGPGGDVRVAEARRDARLDELRQWERLKTSASWHHVESQYDLDAHRIKYYQKFIDWARENATPRR